MFKKNVPRFIEIKKIRHKRQPLGKRADGMLDVRQSLLIFDCAFFPKHRNYFLLLGFHKRKISFLSVQTNISYGTNEICIAQLETAHLLDWCYRD